MDEEPVARSGLSLVTDVVVIVVTVVAVMAYIFAWVY